MSFVCTGMGGVLFHFILSDKTICVIKKKKEKKKERKKSISLETAELKIRLR